MNSIHEVWNQLSQVMTLRFTSRSQSSTSWSGQGRGIVLVSQPTPDILIFTESGKWQQTGGREMRFTNVFRWTRTDTRLQLEHLRFGAEQPVFLFEMTPDENGIWREEIPHPCRADCYRATLSLQDEHILVNWAVNGPQKSETISYVYD